MEEYPMRKKERFCVIIIALLLIALFIIKLLPGMIFIILMGIYDSLSKEEITSLINTNQVILNETIQNIKQGKDIDIEGLSDRVNIANIEIEDGYVEFFCGGMGKDYYVGFYYSENNIPRGWQNDFMVLSKKDFGFEYKQINGDNYYYTERIQENWYYYQMKF